MEFTHPTAWMGVPVTGPGFGPRVTVDDLMASLPDEPDPLWSLIRREASVGAANEPQLASTLYASVLVADSLEESLATVLANRLDAPYFQATQWAELFREVAADDQTFGVGVRADISAVMTRDPASAHAVVVVLYYKGFHALTCHRLAHWLWLRGRGSLALYLQSAVSARFGVDIHPAAVLGHGVMMDHATGIVVGETAVVGNNVSLLHNVTLGGTGKTGGDRHPKVRDGVLIGAGASVLGNVVVGVGAHVAAGSVVLKDVAGGAVVSGVPAKVVGTLRFSGGSRGMPALSMDHRESVVLASAGGGEAEKVRAEEVAVREAVESVGGDDDHEYII